MQVKIKKVLSITIDRETIETVLNAWAKTEPLPDELEIFFCDLQDAIESEDFKDVE